jgi:hypothetical protein
MIMMWTNTTATKETVQTHRPNCFTRLPDKKRERKSVHWKYENNNIDRSQREKWETSTYMYIFILILSY